MINLQAAALQEPAMNIQELIDLARVKGYTVKPSPSDPNWCVVDCGPNDNHHEKMRLTAEGGLLVSDDGRWWQPGPISEVYNWLESIK